MPIRYSALGLTRAVLAVYAWALLGSISNTWSSIRTRYRYTQFCEIYPRWLRRPGLSMRQVHRAGARLFDYTDQKPRVIDPTTGEVIKVELSVAVLGPRTILTGETLAIAGGLR